MLDAINRALRLAGKKALGAILLLVGLVVVAIIASLAGELWDNYHTAILRILAALVFALFLSSTIGQRDFRRRFFASFRSGEDPREALASEEESIKPQVVAAREEITQEHIGSRSATSPNRCTKWRRRHAKSRSQNNSA
jgi:uncharacterized membrane protein YcjF (UPF0283 family)